MQRALVLFNPFAGRGRAAAWAERARARLVEDGWAVEVVETEHPGHASELVAERRSELRRVVVVGGDGTLREAAAGLGVLDELAPEPPVPLGFVPLGNANVVARELGIPLEPESALRVLSGGAPRVLDVGRVSGPQGERLFLAMVGVGYDGVVTRRMQAARGAPLLGRWYRAHADSLYLLVGAGSLLELFPPRFALTVDGEPRGTRYCSLCVSNLATYAKGWAMTPDALGDDGLLDYQARKRALGFGALSLAAAARRRHAPAFLSDYGRGRRFVVEGARPFAWQADGDPQGVATRLEIEVLPGRLAIVVG